MGNELKSYRTTECLSNKERISRVAFGAVTGYLFGALACASIKLIVTGILGKDTNEFVGTVEEAK